jgi:hypothetical protein
MTTAPNPPSAKMGEFELPPSAAVATQNRKEVTWTGTTNEKGVKTIEIRLFPVKYQIAAHLSVSTVLKTTMKMFLASDPAFHMVSRANANTIIKTVAELDHLSTQKLQELFPAKMINGKATLRLFAASSMTINRLKKASYGFYDYASPHIWVTDDVFESTDIRKFGFMLRKDTQRVDRNNFTSELQRKLQAMILSDEDKQRLADARDHLPFAGALPNFQTRASQNVTINSLEGRVKTSALTLHCDAPHVNLMSKLIDRYYQESDTDEKFVPDAMLYGKDPTHLTAYRHAIVFQNQYLSNVRVLPVIGLHPKAMKALIQLGNDEPTEVLTLIRRYPYFTSIEPTPSSESLGKYIFLTTREHFDAAKQFILLTLPKIWQQIDNNFLEELPSSVQCPRLTNSNLRDESTRKTVAMLSKSPIPDAGTIASKWSAPPQIHKLPNSVSVNYSNKDKNLQELPTKQTQQPVSSFRKGNLSPAIVQPMDSSAHSNASATSAGTTFTRDDAQSMFTSLTESFVERLDNQNAIMDNQNKMMEKMMTRQDEKFEKMMMAFAGAFQTKKKKKKKSKRTDQPRRAQSELLSEHQLDNAQNTTTDATHRPMDTEATPQSIPASHPEPELGTDSSTDSKESQSLSSDSSETNSQQTATSDDTYTLYDQEGMRRTAANKNLLLQSAQPPPSPAAALARPGGGRGGRGGRGSASRPCRRRLAPGAPLEHNVARDIETITASTQDSQMYCPGTDDDNEWQGDDLFEGATHNTHQSLAIKATQEDQSVDTVLDQATEDQSFETIRSDDMLYQHEHSPDSPGLNHALLPALATSTPPNAARNPRHPLAVNAEQHTELTQGYTASQLLSKQNTLAPALKTPKELPWNVVPSPGKRKANVSPTQPNQLTIRKSTSRGYTPKKLFQPATPHEEAPAPKK